MATLPKYDLQTLFDMREQKKKETEDTYAEAQKKLAAEDKKLKNMQKQLEDMKTLRTAKKIEYTNAMQKEVMTIEKIDINNRHLEMLEKKEEAFKLEIEKQKEMVAQAKKASSEALKIMLKATQDFKSLEKHKEKWLKEVKKAIAKKESDAADEISQAQYFSRMKEQK